MLQVAAGNSVYGRVSGLKHRIDVSVSARGDAAACSLPHGLVGQSFSSTAPRHGKKDLYPIAGSFISRPRRRRKGPSRTAFQLLQYELAGPYDGTAAGADRAGRTPHLWMEEKDSCEVTKFSAIVKK